MSILNDICAHKREEVAVRLKRIPLADVKKQAWAAPAARDFKKAISAAGTNVIAELKRASPSAGVIREDFDLVHIAREYEKAGAAALSVLTDEKYFQGNLEFIPRIRNRVKLPVLQKEFVVSEYQIYEGRSLGADCILLIVKVLTDDELKEFLACASSLGMSALVEVHDENELERALRQKADIIGINNRNLRDFSVDIGTTLRLAPSIPPGRIIVSESGIKTPGDLRRLRAAGVSAFLMGEHLLRREYPGEALRELVRG